MWISEIPDNTWEEYTNQIKKDDLLSPKQQYLLITFYHLSGKTKDIFALLFHFYLSTCTLSNFVAVRTFAFPFSLTLLLYL